MAQLGQAFDASTVPADDYLPAGDYEMRVIESKEYSNKKGTGRILELVLSVDSGPRKGQRIWQRINYVHNNPTAQKIGQQMLAKIVKATGVPSPLTDTDVLHHKPFIGSLKVVEDDFGKKNELKGAKPFGSPMSQAPANDAHQNQQQPVTAGAGGQGETKPWD